MTELIGHDIGRYHITEQLGVGGMATVYKAYDTRLERDVAIKVIRKEAFGVELLGRMLKRFEREARALAKLTHPNIVSIFDYGEHEGSPYLVMQYVQGGTLKKQMGTPVPSGEAARLLLPVARALEYAHGRDVVHRDVKPANILLTDNRDRMLSDFGIAKLLDADAGGTLTGANVGIGTPEYMSPEQGMGKAVDGRADIYSLGVVYYELVTGRKPYTADTPMAVVIKQINDPLPDPKLYVSGLTKDAERLIYRALAKQPENRYQTMGEFAEGLEHLSAQAVTQAPTAYQTPVNPILPPRPTATKMKIDNLAMVRVQKRRRVPAWGYAVGGGVVLLVFILAGIFALPRLTAPAAAPAKTAQPTASAPAAPLAAAAVVVQATGTTAATTAAATGKTPSKTLYPPSPFFPNAVVTYQINFTDIQAVLKNGGGIPYGTVEIKGNALAVSKESGIKRYEAVGNGSGIVVLFKTSAGTDANIVFFNNPGNASKYIGIKANSQGLVTSVGVDGAFQGGDALTGNLVYKNDHWYYALVQILPQGDFYLKAWDKDNPGQYLEKKVHLAKDWAQPWYGAVTTNPNNTGEIDVQSYQELRFP